MDRRFIVAVVAFFSGFALMFTPPVQPFLLYEIGMTLGMDDPGGALARVLLTIGVIMVIWSLIIIVRELYSITKTKRGAA
ncbi:hypothetical protein ACP26L_12305 [Paenibacillus sp. S-38]|uniref:hypothetical protein n=1 Tax=Paenibacillus sp. S-38 TaxID=3416710 RepID=UPI003CF12FE5